jgi:hypothetical protein
LSLIKAVGAIHESPPHGCPAHKSHHTYHDLGPTEVEYGIVIAAREKQLNS